MESLKLLEKTITSWSVLEVIQWLKHMNFSQYEKKFQENDISGDILIHLNHESLKEIGILSAGHRLTLLKAIYRIKIDQNIPIEPEHYIPISEINELNEYSKLGIRKITKLTQAIFSHDKQLNNLEEDIKILKKNLSKIQEDITSIFKIMKDFKPSQRSENATSTAANLLPNKKNQEKSLHLKAVSTHSQISPIQLDSELDSPIFPAKSQTCRLTNIQSNQTLEMSQKNYSEVKEEYFVKDNFQSPMNSQELHESIEMFKSFRIGLNDPCRKVLLEALKKYRINSNWKEYALVLCYDNKERYIELDEKPMLLFQQLQKDEKKPIFILKQIKKTTALSQISNSTQETKTESDTSNTFENTL